MSTSHELIRTAVARSAILIDRKDWDALDTLFTSDATFDYPAPLGSHSTVASLRQTLQATLQDISTQHALTTQTIELNGAAASVTTFVTTTIVTNVGTSTNIGSYDDELVMDSVQGQERWRIAKRVTHNFPQ
ncbi:hypothetical protein CC86DRAFT_371385 [Ophiobolus disseminans]|uniref:SnoaL-like domain-containing protein n=1 Tax=Ophiobolus disseminans TaxID=1469910 RepID=A0A6A6ZWZ3_9PLEO|nr:hypothetical protein CC86DRAFT_371385 [Ophiobolus disseminans]